KSFGGDLNVPLFSLNDNNDQQLKLFGIPLSSGLSGIVANQVVGVNYGLTENPIPTRLHLSFDAHNLDFKQTLWEQVIPTKVGPYIDSITPFLQSAGVELGSLEEKFPNITVNSSNPQADGSLTASTDVNVTDLNLEMGALASEILDLPPVATTFQF